MQLTKAKHHNLEMMKMSKLAGLNNLIDKVASKSNKSVT